MSVKFTTSPFVRAHGREPSPTTWGTWFMQEATSSTAFDAELVGPVSEFSGTLSSARRQAREAFPAGSLVAVLS